MKILNRIAIALLAFCSCVGCVAESSDAATCQIAAAGPGALSCGEGGCQATWTGCDADPALEHAATFDGIACVSFPELGEWRCYW